MLRDKSALFLFIVLLGLFGFLYYRSTKTIANSSQSTSFVPSVTIEGKSINVEIANTNITRQKGLSGRESLDDGSGMLFDFEKEDTTPGFWMKDMNFAIDIVWINDGAIIGIEKEVPPPPKDAKIENLRLYYPPKPVDYVLELPSGYSDKSGFEVGNSVTLDI